MPLLRRKPVTILASPDFAGVPDDAQVFYLKATGEIFLDYESYSSRMTYLLQRIFQCEFSGKGNMDYFQAQESEQSESRVVRERFPDELKGRVLATVQFQVQGRLDVLVDLVYERFKDRYFPSEKVFVDLGGDKYFARIAGVFPPTPIRNLARESYEQSQKPVASTSALSPLSSLSGSPPPPRPAASTSASASASTSTDPNTTPSLPTDPAALEKIYAPYVHKIGTDLDWHKDQARKHDDPDEYLYTVQLMDEDHKFEGSFMEVKGKALSRDRLAFSKSILKRYMRECVQRDPLIASPWIVKPAIAIAFGIPTSQTEEMEEKNRQIREGKLARRRRTADGNEHVITGPVAKRRKVGEESSKAGTPQPDRKPGLDPKKPVKYPIEDLDLDPMSIIDGRILRRLNSDLPSLPPKPIPSKEMVVPTEIFDRFLQVWNMLNVFSKPVGLSTFTLDEFADALNHQLLEPRCLLIAEIHASLTNIIGTDTSRVLGSTGAPPLLPVAGATTSSSPAPEEDELEYEEQEDDALIRMGVSYAKRWDRTAKLKSADFREGWERHMIGAVCQRGGPYAMPNFSRIMRHLLGPPGKSYLPPPAPINDGGIPPSSQLTDIEPEPHDPEVQYLSLDLEDKLDIIHYLVTLALGSKVVRVYIEESEG